MRDRGKKDVLVLGGLIYDRILRIPEYPAPGLDAVIEEEAEFPGGCALNAAVTMQALDVLPHIVSVIGAGTGDAGLEAYLKAHGLPTDCLRRVHDDRQIHDARTGYCITFVDGRGERTFFTKKGVESRFDPSMVPEELRERLAAVFLTGYYLLDPEYDDMLAAFLESLDVPLFFDPGALAEEIRPEILRRVLQRAYCVTPNEYEYGLVQNLLPEELPLLVLKKGIKGGVAFFQGKEYSVFPYDVESVDTTGAGDAFAGGLIAALLRGTDIVGALKVASACASLATTVAGPHGRFSREEIESLIEKNQELRL
jgi:sugar/nucleoside kinase (ribokinase family)